MDAEGSTPWGEERDTEPTPLRRPKRFDEWGHGGAAEQWPPRLEGGGGEGPSAEQRERQRRQQRLQGAVQKLEKSGAQVGLGVAGCRCGGRWASPRGRSGAIRLWLWHAERGAANRPPCPALFSRRQVFLPDPKESIDWGILAGYDDQKRQIEDTLLLALLHPGARWCLGLGCERGFGAPPPLQARRLAGLCCSKHWRRHSPCRGLQ